MLYKKTHFRSGGLFIFLFLIACSSNAQNFTWMHGSSSLNQPGFYGTKGVPSLGNAPGARLSAASWKDINGDLWLFGGSVPGSNLSMLLRNDLWKYNVSTNEWTWMHGSTLTGQYGTSAGQGIASLNNTPGARSHAITWTDASGNFWLYGGVGFALSGSGDLADLWKYEIATNMWTCMSSGTGMSQKSVYGTLGVSSPANKLGSRRGAVAWTDLSGNMWLFGGLGYDKASNYGALNELWRYTPSNNEWTWMGGSSSGKQNGKYGSLGIPSGANMPGGRYNCAWSADASGNLLLFGGSGHDISSQSVLSLNDLWKYDLSTDQWTWIGGSKTNGQTGTYGTLGVPAPSNMPGSRGSSVFWTDAGGKFYVFGGHGYSSVPGNELNDLWEYNSTTNEWTWLKGSNLNSQAGTYGMQGTLAPGNIPGARSGAVHWEDNSGNLWLLGGYTPTVNALAIYNDLWKLSFCTSTPPLITISGSQPAICSGQGVTLNAGGATYYSWNGLPSGTSSSVTVFPPFTSTYAVSGMDLNGCSSTSQVIQVVNPLPKLTVSGPPKTPCVGENATLNVSGATTYTWNNGTVGAQLTVNVSNIITYTVTGTDANGCANSAVVTVSPSACTGIDDSSERTLRNTIYPNPGNGIFTLQLEQEAPAEVRVCDLKGTLVFYSTIHTATQAIDLTEQSKGVYLLEIKQEGLISRHKLVKM